ncbi:serine hydrolase domain-containing protein [Nocardia sp. NPDC051981]|uniref:serine hydrolase domain-containing protein n=1 Tax=Nocardia sp. NPDC051981 TaxID=3155417 RepID=UPI00342E1FCD
MTAFPGTAPAELDAEHWRHRLAEIAARHAIPGAVLAISHGDRFIEAAHGVLNVDTGVETTVDSLFQIGSITKVWTATAVMRLVDQGRLDLDAPLQQVLPGLRLADPDTTRRITMRHLLTHTSGIDGDTFADSGRGDDCLERYLPGMADLPPIHPLGATWSYGNSGFILAGRVIEVLTGMTWDAAMADLLFAPLGLSRTVTLPEQAILHSAAVGHLPGPDGRPRRAAVWVLPRCAGPAGLINSTVRDVIAFARMHLDHGVAADGQRLLSEDLVGQMQAEQAVLPGPDLWPGLDSWGLGWFRMDWNGQRVIGHDGGTIGQNALLRVLPAHRLAFTLLTNGGRAIAAMTELCAEIAELVGVGTPKPFGPPDEPVRVDASRWTGVYERPSLRWEVTEAGDGLDIRMVPVGARANHFPERLFRMIPVAEDRFVGYAESDDTWLPATFYRLADGTTYMQFGSCSMPRTEGSPGL